MTNERKCPHGVPFSVSMNGCSPCWLVVQQVRARLEGSDEKMYVIGDVALGQEAVMSWQKKQQPELKFHLNTTEFDILMKNMHSLLYRKCNK